MQRRFNALGVSSMAIRIGIPRALFYYSYYPWFAAFFAGLGYDVVISSPTSKQILDHGVRETVTDACVPIKLYHGHVVDLIPKADILFVPRLVCTHKLDGTYCPKFLGLPDMIRLSIKNLPPLLTPRIDLKSGLFPKWRLALSVGRELNHPLPQIFSAYVKAEEAERLYRQNLQNGIRPGPATLEALRRDRIQPLANPRRDLTIGLLGYPYEVHDRYLSVDMIGKLENLGVEVVTMEQIPPEVLRKQGRVLPKDLFWTYSNHVIRATFHLLHTRSVDGIIHLTAFGCGPDAMVDRMMEIECRQRKMPFLTMTIDEHTGDAGVATRLEAFTDLLRRKKEAV